MNRLIDDFKNVNLNLDYVIIIQKYWKGYYIRKKLRKLKDNMTKNIIELLLNKYIENLLFIENINLQLSYKKCRKENFPSHISENIVKFAIFKKYNIMPSWDTKCGDLTLLNKKIEIKGFTSKGPSSFGPQEKWHWIYFIDGFKCKQKYFIIYEIKLSNTSDTWRNIKFTKKSGTYGQIADANKRGQLRANFYKIIKPQIKNHCDIIFDGYLHNI